MVVKTKPPIQHSDLFGQPLDDIFTIDQLRKLSYNK
jgi:hypothetical protein